MVASLHLFARRQRAHRRYRRSHPVLEELEPRVALASSLAPTMAAALTITPTAATAGPSARATATTGTAGSPSQTNPFPGTAGTVSPPSAATTSPGTGLAATATGNQQLVTPGLLTAPGTLTAAAQPLVTVTQLVDAPLPYGVTPAQLQATLPNLLVRTLPLYEQPASDIGRLGLNEAVGPAPAANPVPIPLPIPISVGGAFIVEGPQARDGGPVGAAAKLEAAPRQDGAARAAVSADAGASAVRNADLLGSALDWYFVAEEQAHVPDADVHLPVAEQRDLGPAWQGPALLVAGWAFLEEGRRGHSLDEEGDED